MKAIIYENNNPTEAKYCCEEIKELSLDFTKEGIFIYCNEDESTIGEPLRFCPYCGELNKIEIIPKTEKEKNVENYIKNKNRLELLEKKLSYIKDIYFQYKKEEKTYKQEIEQLKKVLK